MCPPKAVTLARETSILAQQADSQASGYGQRAFTDRPFVTYKQWLKGPSSGATVVVVIF
jgi:hypothetical protein